MSFFKKIFSSKGRLSSLRKAVRQQRWADALVEGELIDRSSLAPEELPELDDLLAAAGDSLAEINLEEGEAFLRAGEPARAREHFSLAVDQAHDPRLQERARSFLASPAEPAAALAAATACCSTGCTEAAPLAPSPVPAGNLDAHTHLDLLLSSYPPDLARRYAEISGSFLDAFLEAHEGNEEAALAHFAKVAPAHRDDLFYFERGALLARSGDVEAAAADLELALSMNPQQELAMQLMVGIDFARGRDEAGKSQLLQMIQDGNNLSFAHGQLAALRAREGNTAQALEHAMLSLEHGADPETCLLAATLLEKAGRLDEAERCLSRLTSSGCGGGVNPFLAEFWLRHRKNPQRALEAFKGALRQEPENSRWRLRIAQAYLACGWRKESLSMLNALLDDAQLEQPLRQEVVACLEQCR